MPLSFKEFSKLRDEGVSVEEISSGRTTATPTRQPPTPTPSRFAPSTPEVTPQQGADAKDFLKQPLLRQLFSKRFAKELPGAAGKVVREGLYGTVAKFGASLKEVPKALFTGKASQKTYDLPGIDPFQSYISEAETRAGEIVEGKDKKIFGKTIPWQARALTPFASVPLAALETVGIGKGIGKIGKVGKVALSTATKRKSFKEVLKMVGKESVTQSDIAQAFKQGRLKKSGVRGGKVTQAYTEHDEKIGKAVQGIVKTKKNPKVRDIMENQLRIDQAIDNTGNEVGTYLNKNMDVIDINTFETNLNNATPTALIKSEASQQNAYDLVKKAALEEVYNRAVPEDQTGNIINLANKRITERTTKLAKQQAVDLTGYTIDPGTKRMVRVGGVDLGGYQLKPVRPEAIDLAQLRAKGSENISLKGMQETPVGPGSDVVSLKGMQEQQLPGQLNTADDAVRLKGIREEEVPGQLETLDAINLKGQTKPKITNADMWDSRKAIDQRIKREFGEALADPDHRQHAAVTQAWRAVRDEMNTAVIEGTRGGAEHFGNQMERMHYMYLAADNMGEKFAPFLKQAKIAPMKEIKFFDRHPYAKKIGAGAVIGGSATYGARRIFGRGGGGSQ